MFVLYSKKASNLKLEKSWIDYALERSVHLNLTQALEFLIDEHVFIDELYAQLMGASIVFQDVSNHILEKNIYGVDINEESVDILVR